MIYLSTLLGLLFGLIVGFAVGHRTACRWGAIAAVRGMLVGFEMNSEAELNKAQELLTVH